MRHFLQGEAKALPVLSLPEGVDVPSIEGVLILSSGAAQALPAGRRGADTRAV